MSLFPMFVKLQGRLVTIIGGGKIAESKIPGLLEAAACIRVIAPNVSPKIAEWIRNGQIVGGSKAFAPGDFQDTHLVIAATSSSAANHEVFLEAEAQKIWCNSVDDIENCHFYYGSIVQRGDLQIAISTTGKSPALAQRIRKELEEQFDSSYAGWLQWLGTVRQLFFQRQVEPGLRKQTLHRISARAVFERFKSFRERKIQGGQRG